MLIVLDGAGRAQVIHGNYDIYERMRILARGENSEKSAGKEPKRESNEQAKPAAGAKRKRRFPYRKLEELEADISGAEKRLRELEILLASPDLYRDGEETKESTRDFQETKAQLQQLYDHWEEAVELS